MHTVSRTEVRSIRVVSPGSHTFGSHHQPAPHTPGDTRRPLPAVRLTSTPRIRITALKDDHVVSRLALKIIELRDAGYTEISEHLLVCETDLPVGDIVRAFPHALELAKRFQPCLFKNLPNWGA